MKEAFDDLSRALASGMSRRDALRKFGIALAGSVLFLRSGVAAREAAEGSRPDPRATVRPVLPVALRREDERLQDMPQGGEPRNRRLLRLRTGERKLLRRQVPEPQLLRRQLDEHERHRDRRAPLRSLPARLSEPLASVVLTTRDRPRFLPIALECYRRQTHPCRELIVVDDGERHPSPPPSGRARRRPPAPARAVRDAGNEAQPRLSRPHGESVCVKMDDDDWYGPRYVATMLAGMRGPPAAICRPTMAYLTPFRFFDVANWLIRRSDKGNVPGATLVFAPRELGRGAVPGSLLQRGHVVLPRPDARSGSRPRPVDAVDTYLAVRHSGAGTVDRGHAWSRQWHGEELDSYLLRRRPVEKTPEALLPRWAVSQYRSLRHELAAERREPIAV